MGLLIDRLPIDTLARRIVLPAVLCEPGFRVPPRLAPATWIVDTGCTGEGFAWREHIVSAGLDPDLGRCTKAVRARHADGRSELLPIREADLWIISNIPGKAPFCVPLNPGMPFRDTTGSVPGKGLIGVRALMRSRLRINIDFSATEFSVWTS